MICTQRYRLANDRGVDRAKFESDTCYVDYIASALEHDTLTMYVWIAQTAPVPALSYQLVREGQTLLRASQTFAIPKEGPFRLVLTLTDRASLVPNKL